MSDPLVSVRDVSRIFEGGRVVALDHVDFDIAPGEFVAITGPSGSGKTTLLNLIGAMDLPSEGEVWVGGTHVHDEQAMEIVRATKIGFIFQRHNLIPVLNAWQNVEIPLIPRERSKRARRERARALLGQVGLAGRADANVRVLSGGERQRVAVARAMANEPPLLLADEPTGNLDSATGHDVMEVVHGMRRRTGAALVLVTHDLRICEGADRRIEMLDGKIRSS